MTTALLLAGLLVQHPGSAQDPAITLRLRAPERPTTRVEPSDANTQLDALAAKATPSGSGQPIEMLVVVEANRAGDVWVDRHALCLELRRLDGAPLRSQCIVEHDGIELRRREEVRLRAGHTMKIRMTVGQSAAARGAVCLGPSPNARRGLGVVAVYDPPDAHAFRMRPKHGATPLTKRVESNLVAIGSRKAK